MSRIAIVFLFFFCTSCQSKPTVEAPVQTPAGKVTPSTSDSSGPLELFSEVAYGPRRMTEIDSGLSLNPKVQDCFRKPSGTVHVPVTVTVDGKITYGGEIEGAQVRGSDPGLEKCLLEALKTVRLGRGRIGPFKMRLSTERDRLKGGKGLILEPAPVRKFE